MCWIFFFLLDFCDFRVVVWVLKVSWSIFGLAHFNITQISRLCIWENFNQCCLKCYPKFSINLFSSPNYKKVNLKVNFNHFYCIQNTQNSVLRLAYFVKTHNFFILSLDIKTNHLISGFLLKHQK